MNYTVDINCDVGEGIGNEEQLMPFISSCNIACGAHAGDEKTISDTIKLALQNDVKIGAHPSFPDKQNFGRKILQMSLLELQQSLESQIRLMNDIAESLGTKLNHVKAHGALYNLAANDEQTAKVLINAVLNTVLGVFLYVPYDSLLQKLAQKRGMKTKIEAFADRNYNTNLTLVSRKEKHAVLTSEESVAEHLLKMITEHKVKSIDGVEVEIHADTFCVHGDNSKAVEILKYVSDVLQKNGIKIA